MYPIFITDEEDAEVEISSLPGQKRWGINKLKAFLEPLVKKGLRSVILFGVPVKAKKVSFEWAALCKGIPRTESSSSYLLGRPCIFAAC